VGAWVLHPDEPQVLADSAVLPSRVSVHDAAGQVSGTLSQLPVPSQNAAGL